MIAQDPDFLSQQVVIGRDGSGLAEGAEVFSRVETEATRCPHRSGFPILVFGPVRLSRVLNHRNAVKATNLKDGIHLGALTKKMDGNDRFGADRDGCLDLRGVHRVGPLFDVDEDRFRSGISNGLRCRHESARNGDNLISSAHAGREQGEPKSIRAISQSDGVATTAVSGKIFLELGDKWTAGKGAGVNYLGNGSIKFRPMRGVMRLEIEKRYFHELLKLIQVRSCGTIQIPRLIAIF